MAGVLAIDGGNAALCAALTAREQGTSVLLLEAAPRGWHGGNSQHTHNLRCMYNAPQDVLMESYPEEEFWQDLWRVAKGNTSETLACLVTRTSSQCRDRVRQYDVNFQPPLSNALHVARANIFFMGGRKTLVNIYYRSAEKLGVQIRYDTPVQALGLHNGEPVAALTGGEHITAKSCMPVTGGFEPNREWLREAWGEDTRGEWPTDSFPIRDTRFNQGILLKFMVDAGADIIGDPFRSRCMTVDAGAPLYDGGICTHMDCVLLDIVVNRDTERFYDEGEDFWPKHYAIWGRLAAQQPGQISYSIIDSKAIGHFMPPVFPGAQANTLAELAFQLGLDVERFTHTVTGYNNACQPGQSDHTVLNNCATKDLLPTRTHWVRPLDQPLYYGYALRPGITFTYLRLKVNEHATVHFAGLPDRNLFVAGEMVTGNMLDKGYAAGMGMSIGTTFGRIAGEEAALAVRKETRHEAA